MFLTRIVAKLMITILALSLCDPGWSQDDKPITATDPAVPIAHLGLALIPLTAEQLQVEAAAWRDQLQGTVTEIGSLEIRILQIQGEERAAAMRRMEDLLEQRAQDIGRLNLVLHHLTEKTGLDANDQEPELVRTYRLYISSVDGLRPNMLDPARFVSAIWEWVVSSEGGLRILRQVALLLAITFGFWLLGKAMARGVVKALELAGKSSQMMKTFIKKNIPKTMLIFGFLFGLAVMGINITPILAVIGGASFVIAFALQDTLSNFASGVMIMFYKPFDIDDYVNTAGIEGTVKSMTLVSTTISTIDNKMIVVPNNSIWGDVITNVTGVLERRVDLVFGIGYADDMAKAEKILWEVVKAHPAVLDEPEPLIKVHELADSSVNFICRPWVKTDDYWDVYWDMTRRVKERFDEEGVSIPFPQRDVHLYREDPIPSSS